MLLPRFQYHEAKDAHQAIRFLGEFGDQAKVLAGGTDLLVNMKLGHANPKQIIHIGRIPSLNNMEQTDEEWRIGSLMTAADMALQRDRLGAAGMIAQAASVLGTPLIRNRATIGGNVITARPAADMLPPLMALDAKLTLVGPAGERQVDLNNFVTGVGQTVLCPDELLTFISITKPDEGTGTAYIKLGTRKTLEISLVNVAVALSLKNDGTVSKARIVMGAVGPTPLRATRAENILVGERIISDNDSPICGAAIQAAQEASPIDDHRGSAKYRQHMVEVLTNRALAQAWSMAQGDKS